MPRLHRFHAPGVPLHLIQRGNNRAACFADDADRRVYLAWLREGAEETGCSVHAYVLMGNHVHLLLTPSRADAPSALMQALGRRYVRYYNDAHRRTGTLWEGRFRSSPIHARQYMLACMRYIELNPVRAGIVPHPAAYPWSSFRANALRGEDRLVTPHALYFALARDAESRRLAYLDLFRGTLDDSVIARIRDASNRGQLLSDAEGRTELLAELALPAARRPRGRPRHPTAFNIAEK